MLFSETDAKKEWTSTMIIKQISLSTSSSSLEVGLRERSFCKQLLLKCTNSGDHFESCSNSGIGSVVNKNSVYEEFCD
jgi:hypothetical protein